MPRILPVLLAALALGWAPGCGDSGTNPPDLDAFVIGNDGTVPPPFTVTQLQPEHGPVGGGTFVTIRGFGFADGSRVFFGDLMVDEAFTFYEGPNRLLIVTPPGTVGPVDVRVLRPDGESTTFQEGYRYDLFSVDPNSGSTAGGTFVRIVGSETS